MVINLMVIALLIGLVLGFNLASLVPRFSIKVVQTVGLFRGCVLGYEKFTQTNSDNRTEKRSRYFCKDRHNYKTTCTGKIYFSIVFLSVVLFELMAVGIYFLMA